MSIKCKNCQVENADDARYCEGCGMVLDIQPDGQGEVKPPKPVDDSGGTGPGPDVNPQVIVCPNPQCRAQVPADADHCPSCGQPMKEPPIKPPSQFITGRFTVVSAATDVKIPTGKVEILIGRQDVQSSVFPDVDLDAFDGINNGVSRRHCKLTLQGGLVYIEDLQSVNHTTLRQQQLVPGQKYVINDGDEVILGKLRLIYHSN